MEYHLGLNNALYPMLAPGRVTAMRTTTAMIIIKDGIKTLLYFPIPSFKSLWEMNQIISHKTIKDPRIGRIMSPNPDTELVECSKVSVKYKFGLLPHP